MLENFFFKAAESVSARNLVKSVGLVKLSISIFPNSFDFFFQKVGLAQGRQK